MYIQNSYVDESRGKLYIIPTPIGNLEDITYRAVRLLGEVDLIAAEDTRHTKKLLSHFNIQKETISYHEHNHQERMPYLLERLKKGETIGLVSDAGMPAISDPGYDLVIKAIEEKVAVIVLPGANAALTALVGSGLATDEFLFTGFLPRKKKDKEAVLRRLKSKQATLIIYESPHRILDTLGVMEKILGNRRMTIARELTKMYEQFIRGSISELVAWLQDHPVRGECVLVVEGVTEELAAEENWWKALSLQEHVTYYEQEANLSHKEAMRAVAKDRGISRREVYQALHVDK